MVVHATSATSPAALDHARPRRRSRSGPQRKGIDGRLRRADQGPGGARRTCSSCVDELNSRLNRWETIKEFRILDRDLTVEDGRAHAALKVKRKVVENKYSGVLIESMYAARVVTRPPSTSSPRATPTTGSPASVSARPRRRRRGRRRPRAWSAVAVGDPRPAGRARRRRRSGHRRRVQPPPPRPHAQRRAVPDARFHDYQAIYHDDVWDDRAAEGFHAGPSHVWLLETPGHTPQDITHGRCEPADGVVVLTHLWWIGRRSARRPLRTGRRRAACIASADLGPQTVARSSPATGPPSSPDRLDAGLSRSAHARRCMPGALHRTVNRAPPTAPPRRGGPRGGRSPFGFYVHVPFCTARCGYCDFNTYTAEELRGDVRERHVRRGGDAPRSGWPAGVLGDVRPPGVDGVLRRRYADPAAAGRPGAMLARARRGVRAGRGAEVTTEANPDSVTRRHLEALREAGFTRISLRHAVGACPHVLATLDRTHDPLAGGRGRSAGPAPAGFEQVSLDLIYGTPGESLADWRHSLEAALACGPDHVSAYALIVEDGTALARQVRRGELPMPDDDDLADKYLLADERARGRRAAAGTRCRTGRARREPAAGTTSRYWTGDDWWGVGPGAHTHVGGVRWWNVKHPRAYAERIAAGDSPAHGPRGARRRDAAGRAGAARGAAARGLGTDVLRRRGVEAARTRVARAVEPDACVAVGSCSPCGAACWPTPSSAG